MTQTVSPTNPHQCTTPADLTKKGKVNNGSRKKQSKAKDQTKVIFHSNKRFASSKLFAFDITPKSNILKLISSKYHYVKKNSCQAIPTIY